MKHHLVLHALSSRRGTSRRSYLTLITPPGAGDQHVVRVHIGVLGGGRHVQESSYGTMAEAVTYMRETVAAQLQNGFRLVTMDRKHPLREWLDSEQVHAIPPEPRGQRRSTREEPMTADTAEQLSLF
jgi:hypothetical protein